MRPVHLLHDARNLARMLSIDPPCCAQVAMSTAGAVAPFAAFVDGNPLGESWLVDAELPSRRIVSWSGSLGAGLFDDEPRTWMRAGQERFAAFLDEVAPSLVAHGRTLCFRPHHRHVLGDVHACVRLLRERPAGPFEILLSPADLLAPSMRADAEDHLRRIFAHLGPVAAGVLLTDLPADLRLDEAPADHPSDTRFGEGTLPPALIAELLATHVPEATPVILLPGALEAQRAAAGLAGA